MMRISSITLLLLGATFLFYSLLPFGEAPNTQSPISNLQISYKERSPLRIVFDCSEKKNCPYLESSPLLELSSSWLVKVRQALNAVGKLPVQELPVTSVGERDRRDQYGFSSPTLFLQFQREGQTPETLTFGTYNSFFEGYYLARTQENTSQFSLAPKALRALFEISTDELFQKSLFPGTVQANAVRQLAISGQDMSPVVLSVVPEGWLVNRQPADESFVRGYLSDLFSLPVTSVIPLDKDNPTCDSNIFRTYSFQYATKNDSHNDVLSVYRALSPQQAEKTAKQNSWCVRRGSMPYFYITSDSVLFSKRPREEHFIESIS